MGIKRLNRKGDFSTIIYLVAFLFIVAVVMLFTNKLNGEIFGELEDSLEDEYNNTESINVLIDIKEKDSSGIWDYAFLGIFLGSLIAIGLSAWAIRISPVFFWIYGIMSLFVLGLGVVLSNVWQDMAADAEFASTISNFAITNMLLGSYYPLIVTGVIILTMGIMFGKPPEGGEA